MKTKGRDIPNQSKSSANMVVNGTLRNKEYSYYRCIKNDILFDLKGYMVRRRLWFYSDYIHTGQQERIFWGGGCRGVRTPPLKVF